MRWGVGVWQDVGVKENLSKKRRPQRRLRPGQIRALLRRHARSGLSLLAFAGQSQHCYSTLLRWRAQHGRALARWAGGAKPADKLGARPAKSAPAFIPVEVNAAAYPAQLRGGEDFILEWPGRCTLRVPAGFQSDGLRRLLEVLGEARP